MNFTDLRKNLKKDFSGMKKVRLAITADWATQMLAQAVRGYGYTLNLDIQIYEAAYDQMEGELLDPQSDLYKFNPEYILIFPCTEKFSEKFYGAEEEHRGELCRNEIQRLENLCSRAQTGSGAKVMISNFCERDDGVYGNLAGAFQHSLLYTIRKLNMAVADMVMSGKYNLIDINSLQSRLGYEYMCDNRLYYISKTIFSMDALVHVAGRVCSAVSVLSGKVKKCLITDLDNTLWGGVIGDDGMEGIQIGDLGIGKAFSDLQHYIKELSQRGIAIAVCSKNNEATAKLPFEQHPDMVLRLKDIAVFTANWEDKASNIEKIRQTLNIGMDSLVFIDDNPFERELVRSVLPEVTVPEMPKEPTEYTAYLRKLNLFETAAVSDEDRIRTKQYQQEAKRLEIKDKAASFEGYLESLGMKGEIKSFDSFSVPRVAQLTQRSNQFNLRTQRYTENQIRGFMDSPDYITAAVSASDKFGDYGVVSVIILKKLSPKTLFIDTLIMSCRVLKRTLEEFIFNEITAIAAADGAEFIEGEYLPTAKNLMTAELFAEYGFTKIGQDADGATRWKLALKEYEARKTFVEKR